MASRHPFGGGIDDWIFAEDENGVPVFQGGAALTFWNAREGGTQYSITQDVEGTAPIAVLVTSAGGDGYRKGQIPVFYGPPDVTTMWVSADGGERVAVDAIDVGDLAGRAQQDLADHVAQLNGHGTVLGSLSDVQIGAVDSRITGDLVGWNGSAFVMLSPSSISEVPQRSTPLRTWHYALANRFYGPARIAAIGSSTTEGVGQTAYDRTYLARLRYALRTRFPVPGVVGGDNYAPSWGNPTYPWPVTRTAGVATDSNRGWGLKAVLLSATGHALTHTFTGTSVQVWYSQYAGGGTFSVEVDGVTVAAAVNTNGATDRNAKWVSAALSAGAHTIVVRYVSGSTVYVHGFASYNGDENAGINIYNGGLSGLQSGGILGDVTAWAARLATIQPHLVVLQLGVNDYTGGVPSATMKTNLKAVISAVRANSPTNPSFAIFGSPRVSGGTYAEPFVNYQRAWAEIAAEDTGGYGGASGVAYFDLGLRQPSPADDNSPGLYQADLTHSTDKGASQVADSLAEFLAPR